MVELSPLFTYLVLSSRVRAALQHFLRVFSWEPPFPSDGTLLVLPYGGNDHGGFDRHAAVARIRTREYLGGACRHP